MAPTKSPLTRDAMIEYFVGAFKPRADWRVGIEAEKIPRRAATGSPVPYDGHGPTIRGVLEGLLETLGGNPVYEGEHLIGLDGAWGTVSLEPGGQIEWSSRPAATLDALERELHAYLEALAAAGSAHGVRFLDVGLDPQHPVGAMHWMPKARYKIMRPYMGARGRLAHRMMTQTASIQCAFDFASADDWSRKFRAAVLLAPVAVGLFANSSTVDGRPSGYRSFRQAIWRETEPARCGVPAVVFEPGFGIEAWVDWVCDVPSMFHHRGRGLAPSGGVPFRELLGRTGRDALRPEDWELHLSSIFTEVRSYSYIEVRCADLQPDEGIMAVPAFWTGVLYGDSGPEPAIELGASWSTHEGWVQAMDEAARFGVDGTAGGRALRDLARQALRLSAAGLGRGAPWAGDSDRALGHLQILAERHGLGSLT
jgi:glutamate--cysteine ligase